jgi:hypothetical protein
MRYMPADEKNKLCIDCKGIKPQACFGRDKNQPDGFKRYCKFCAALRKRRLFDKPKIQVQEKRCRHCGETKPAEAFCKAGHSADGLGIYCKSCLAAKYADRRVNNLPKAKRCSGCGLIKASTKFSRHRRSPDGLQSECRECRRIKERIRFMIKAGRIKKEDVFVISSWDQVESLIREMAETQCSINDAKAEYKKQVELLKQDFTDDILATTQRQIRLQLMIEAFARRNISELQNETRKFRFGVLVCEQRKFRIELDTDLARACLGKP